ncbi:hypothetical protein MAR_006502 [Mya arenaria]|uniref:Uncharacterized protein n=1 Tax=Mya arenaria TaxID=6604 RepID=A0ABY7DAC4_MYAAR|nr:hypothetical protein MAR_006502 [Mya arenaria]
MADYRRRGNKDEYYEGGMFPTYWKSRLNIIGIMLIRLDRFMYILVVLAYNSYSSLCIQHEAPRIYQNSEVPTSHQNFQIQMKELRNLAIIKADILRRLGIMDPPMRPTAPPLTTKPPQRSKVMALRSCDITRILSEVPDINYI